MTLPGIDPHHGDPLQCERGCVVALAIVSGTAACLAAHDGMRLVTALCVSAALTALWLAVRG